MTEKRDDDLSVEYLGQDGGDNVYETPSGGQWRVPRGSEWDTLLPKSEDEQK